MSGHPEWLRCASPFFVARIKREGDLNMDPTKIMSVAETAVESAANDSLISLITVFVLAIFVGY